MSDNNFIDGLIVKAPNDRAPKYVKAKLSIKRAELITWLQQQEGEWVNADIKVSQNGKWYAAVDHWKPNGERQERAPRPQNAPAPAGDDPYGDDVPFRQFRHRTYF
jgi:hypothetical protein